MAVTPSRIEIIEGESAVLSASVSPEAASDRAVAWPSSDRSVATVDKAGTVHGLRPGTATVTATAEGKSGTCAVTVKRQGDRRDGGHSGQDGADPDGGRDGDAYGHGEARQRGQPEGDVELGQD